MGVVAARLPAHYLDLVTDALLKVYWYKGSLRKTLRRVGVSESFLATWAQEETKRDFLDRLLPELEGSEAGHRLIHRLADSLTQQTSFPDLQQLEDSRVKIEQAKQSVASLRQYRQQQAESAQQEREREQSRARGRELRQEAQTRQHRLETLHERLNALATRLGTQGAGYEFEEWFYDLLDYYEVENRRPYKVEGRQIDGSVTIEGTTYLNELKFTREQSDAPDIDIFRSKVLSKADNTMGILLSMSGFSSIAIQEASRDKTPLLLLDYNHLYLLFTGSLSFSQLVGRVRRHSSQTGKAYLPVQEFGG